MDEQQVKTSNKNHSKSRRSSRLQYEQLNAENTASVQMATKIIDLNDDCLERIFKYLDFNSLINVAISNRYLRPAASFVYHRRFSNRIIRIKDVRTPSSKRSNSNGNILCEVSKKCIIIRDLKKCLQLLRCLRSSVHDVSIHYCGSAIKRYAYVHQYLNNYCTENLIAITYVRMPMISIECFRKPFPNVARVAIVGCNLTNRFPLFAKYFPNVRQLKLQTTRLDADFMRVRFAQLKDLAIDITNRSFTATGFTANEAARLLKFNRQLEDLTIKLHPGQPLPTSDRITIDKMINSK